MHQRTLHLFICLSAVLSTNAMDRELTPKIAAMLHCEDKNDTARGFDTKRHCHSCTLDIEDREKFQSMFSVKCGHMFHGDCWAALPSLENPQDACLCGEISSIVIKNAHPKVVRLLEKTTTNVIIDGRGSVEEAPLIERIPHELTHQYIPLIYNVSYQIIFAYLAHECWKSSDISTAFLIMPLYLIIHQSHIAQLYRERDWTIDPRLRICHPGRALLAFFVTAGILTIYRLFSRFSSV